MSKLLPLRGQDFPLDGRGSGQEQEPAEEAMQQEQR